MNVFLSFFVSFFLFFWYWELSEVLHWLFNFSCLIRGNWICFCDILRLIFSLISFNLSVVHSFNLWFDSFSWILLNSNILTWLRFCILNILLNLVLSSIDLCHCFLLITLCKRFSMTVWTWRSRRKGFSKLSILLICHVSNLRVCRLFNKLSFMKIVLLLWFHSIDDWFKIYWIIRLYWFCNLNVWNPVHVIFKFTARAHK